MLRLRQQFWPSLVLLGAWALLDALFNLRNLSEGPSLWFLLPSLDVVVLLALIAALRATGRRLPDPARALIVGLALFARIFRSSEGLIDQHFHRPLSLYLDLPLLPELARLLRSTVSPRGWRSVFSAPSRPSRWWLPPPMGAGGRRARVLRDRAARAVRGGRAGLRAAVAAVAERQLSHLHVGLFGASVALRLAREASLPAPRRRLSAAAHPGIATVQAHLRRTPSALDRLHGADVLLFLVESYGETAMTQPALASRLEPVYRAFEADLGARGFGVASSLLVSPVYGGGSWMAHATLATGVRIEDGIAYSLLLAARPPPLTMAGFFRAAGYRTVLVQPGTTRPWPEGEVVGFDRKYYEADLGYRGPSFAWATMPDQYTIDFVHRAEVAAPARAPLFIEYALVCSHAPWSALPRVQADWDSLRGGGAISASSRRSPFPSPGRAWREGARPTSAR